MGEGQQGQLQQRAGLHAPLSLMLQVGRLRQGLSTSSPHPLGLGSRCSGFCGQRVCWVVYIPSWPGEGFQEEVISGLRPKSR